MKKIIIVFVLSNISGLLYAHPLDIPADKELKISKKFLRFEKIQKKHLYKYVRLVKARYLLQKEVPWVSKNILDAINIKAQLSYRRKYDEN
jgi:hypothetical protein